MRMPRVTPVAPNISSLLLVNRERKEEEGIERNTFALSLSNSLQCELRFFAAKRFFFFVEEKGHTMDINKRGYEMRDDYFVT